MAISDMGKYWLSFRENGHLAYALPCNAYTKLEGVLDIYKTSVALDGDIRFRALYALFVFFGHK